MTKRSSSRGRMVTLLADGDKSTQAKDTRMALYLQTSLKEAGDDATFIARALGNIARVRGMSQLARDTGLGHESLYKALCRRKKTP